MPFDMMLQPNAWSCLPAAVAMAVGEKPRDVIEFIGHDGSEIIFPDLPEPQNRRGFHIGEMFWYLLDMVYFPVLVEPYLHYEDSEYVIDQTHKLEDLLSRKSGILLGHHETGSLHAAAWDRSYVWDPRGEKYPISEFGIDGFIALF